MSGWVLKQYITWCVGYKALALFIYQPCGVYLDWLLWRLKHESTCEITLFWELFNEIVSDIKGRDYKFSPRALMVDGNSANYCAIQMTFGVNFVTWKVVSCQMHYKNDINRVSFRIGPSYRDLFKSICYRMCAIATMTEYSEKKKYLDKRAKIFPDIFQWVTWCDARKYDMFPGFRHFGYSNVTLAESGNAMLKHHTQLWHLEAAWDDMSTMLIQINEFNSFLAQVTSSSGKCPCSLTHKKENRATQIMQLKFTQLNLAISMPTMMPLRRTKIHRYLCHAVVVGTCL